MKDNGNYFPGKGCQCSAWNSSECSCGVDWTDPRVYELQAKIAELETYIDIHLQGHQFIRGQIKGINDVFDYLDTYVSSVAETLQVLEGKLKEKDDG